MVNASQGRGLFLVLTALALQATEGFPGPISSLGHRARHARCIRMSAGAASLNAGQMSNNKNERNVPPGLLMTRAEVAPPPVDLGPHLTLKGNRVLNPTGIYFMIASMSMAVLFYPLLTVAWVWSLLVDRKRRRAVDWVVHVWAKCSLLACGCYPTVTGLENLPPHGEAAMYVPNHTSFLDIYSLSGFVPRPLKYVSKVEILRVPLIGWAMRMANHIAIRRNDRKSQLQTFKDAVDSLTSGSSVVTFAEGTRSPDGTLHKFKKGPFKMSSKAGVRIVPVSVCGLHRWMPPSAVLPLAFPFRAVEIVIHPPVDTVGRSEADVEAEVFRAVNSGLPKYQQTRMALPSGSSDVVKSDPVVTPEKPQEESASSTE